MGWLLVTVYGGPVMAAAYVLSCQAPPNERHEDFVRALWKQAFGSSIHCMAGDASGIIAAAVVTTSIGLPMWKDAIGEYLFGFAFGLFIFQALFMRDMAGGSYAKALRASFVPEWLSMNAVMAGMLPVMVILMTRDMTAMQASSLRFWGIMSVATLVGFAVAYPVNLWLVGVGLKHGMGTERALGEGGHSMTADPSVTSPEMQHHMKDMAAMPSRATTAQIVAMGVLTLVMLGAGLVLATLYGHWTMTG